VNFAFEPGSAYVVGDVLTCNNSFLGGSGSGFSFTVTTISTPLASFINSVDSSRWQYITSDGVYHINQFGGVADWIGTDSTATNNYLSLQTVLFAAGAAITTLTTDAGGATGGTVKLGKGTYLINSATPGLSVIVPNGVLLCGLAATASILRVPLTMDVGTHFLCLGNPNSHTAVFNSCLRDLEIFSTGTQASNSGVAVVYSNSAQDGSGVDHVAIYSGNRAGILYEIGFGGASTVYFNNLVIASNTQNPCAIFQNLGSTLIDCRVWSCASQDNGISLIGAGGMFNFENIHVEGAASSAILINLTGTGGATPMVVCKNVTGGGGIPWTIQLDSTNQLGNASFQSIQASSIGTVLNGQTAGTNHVPSITPAAGVLVFNP
jgi:hypothetical protein